MPDKFIVSLITLMLLCVEAIAAGNIAVGEEKSATCAACHGLDGNSSNPTWPNIAGQHAEYIAKQLHDFRSGARKNDQMSPMALGLSDEDIADLSAYYAAQQAKPGVIQPENIALGERLYRAGDAQKGLAACMACHGPDGIGNPAANYPRINAQHAVYTELQLKAFKAEERDNDANNIMRDIASRMSNDDIKAIADYVQGLH